LLVVSSGAVALAWGLQGFGGVAGGEVLDEDVGLQEVPLAGGEGDRIGGYVGGFNADHGEPAVGVHLGEFGGEFGPGVPDDRGL